MLAHLREGYRAARIPATVMPDDVNAFVTMNGSLLVSAEPLKPRYEIIACAGCTTPFAMSPIPHYGG